MKTLSLILGSVMVWAVADAATNPITPTQDKPSYLYTESYTDGEAAAGLAVTSSGMGGTTTSTLIADYFCNWSQTNGGGGNSYYWYQDAGNYTGWTYNYVATRSAQMNNPPSTSPGQALGTSSAIGSTSQAYNPSWMGVNGSWPNNFTIAWEAPLWWEHCVVLMLYPLGQPGRWTGSTFGDTTGIYHRMADAVVKLKTGGKSKSGRQNLFCLTASAAEVGNKMSYSDGTEDNSGNYIISGPTGTVPIPAQSIAIGGLGNLGADNNRWAVLPDDQDIDVTPRVLNKDFYSFNVQSAKYRLRIRANNAVLSPDGIAPNALYCVGQDVNFSVDWMPQAPPYVSGSSFFHWHLNGIYYNASTTPCSTCSTDPFVNANLLANETTSAWWVSGGTPTEYISSIGMNLLFPNGQNASIAAVGKFDMFRPQASVTATTGAVSLDTVYNGTPYLHDGTILPGYPRGILFVPTIVPPAPFPSYSSIQWIQVIVSTLSRFQGNDNTGAWYRIQASNVLDSTNPYPPDPAFPYPQTSDSPRNHYPLSGFKAVSISDSYEMWLMFQPPGGHLVPLRTVNWQWQGSGTLSGTTWTGGGTNTPNPPDTDSTVYPKWTDNILNIHIQPE